MKIKKSIFYWGIFSIYAIIIFYLSTRKIDIPQYHSYQDKWLHFVVYGIYAFLLGTAWSKTMSVDINFKLTINVIIISTVYGVLIEFCQIFYGRHFEIMDMIFNCVGSILGTFTLKVFFKLVTKIDSKLFKDNLSCTVLIEEKDV